MMVVIALSWMKKESFEVMVWAIVSDGMGHCR